MVSLIGIALGIKCCIDYLLPIFRGEVYLAAHMFAIPLLICALCRSFPITVRGEEKLDLSVISVLAIYLTQGADAAVTVYMISSLFSFEHNTQTNKLEHIFGIGFQRLLFNDSTVILSIILPDLALSLIPGWIPGPIQMPQVLIPAALFSLLTFLINGVLQLSMFCLNGELPLAEMAHVLLGLTPNVISAMPMGLLMGFGYSSESYMWFVFIMLFPLLLARYAWKLYLDSESARSHLIKAFINSIEAKDKYTQGHSERVAGYAVQIAKQMKLSRHEIQLIQQGAVLHDIGKIGIADQILNKPDKLDADETLTIQQHPLIGVKVLEEVGLEKEVLEMVRSHHERYDGDGYPEKRAAKDLPIGVRILCVADSYDAMTSDRPYRKGMEFEIVKKILLEGKGSQFDPEVVDAFIASMEKK
ncbi:MAG: HD-GYP domain-containing protein [Clostridia bacterium]|nr:HD-GYP domain-containing protein [Clostridia bacterium]